MLNVFFLVVVPLNALLAGLALLTLKTLLKAAEWMT